jgi:hypothetical protein
MLIKWENFGAFLSWHEIFLTRDVLNVFCISKTYLHDLRKPTKSSSVRCPKTHWHHITSYVFGSGEKS